MSDRLARSSRQIIPHSLRWGSHVMFCRIEILKRESEGRSRCLVLTCYKSVRSVHEAIEFADQKCKESEASDFRIRDLHTDKLLAG